jgi:putative ABC transport system substrate-binding protein
VDKRQRLQRRALLEALAAVVAIGPLRLTAQTRIPLIVVLLNATAASADAVLQAFKQGLGDLGYRENENYRMEIRWSGGRVDRLPELARGLLRLGPDVAVANQVVVAQALQRESKSIPIVMLGGSGAARVGLIESLARPGRNVTGLTNQGDELTGKLFQLLQEIAPGAKRVLALSSGLGAIEQDIRAESRTAAKAYGMTLIEASAQSASQLEPLAERCARERCEALVSLADPNLNSFRGGVTALAASLRVPAVYSFTAFTVDGGLISYSADYAELSRRAATYVDRILKGAKPGELAVERPNKFELIVNMKTAKALGITIPPSILVRADKVID